MSVRGVPAPSLYQPAAYWEARARRFAGEGYGLAAVCSYGMPEFYNRVIHREQRRALAPWLHVPAGTRVLDVGCGVGRWSRLLASRGAQVTGVDLSATMIKEAARRARTEGIAAQCRFLVADIARLELRERFDLVLGVTVLQHILEPAALKAALRNMERHLGPGGRVVLLEAAPTRPECRCDSSIFRARPRAEYMRLINACGLQVQALAGVDPAPFRTHLLPHLRRLPRGWSVLLLAAVTGMCLPLNALLARRALKNSWHLVFVLQRSASGARHGR
jgi:SAM-dependent methyltransferase